METKLNRYPTTQQHQCPQCDATITLTRTGTGRPWRGGLDYWYRSDHDCRGPAMSSLQLDRLFKPAQ